MADRWLTVVGIGDDGLTGLSVTAQEAIDNADVLVGGTRHLEMVPRDARMRIQWRSPLTETIETILLERDKKVTVLATGDPMWFGIGTTLLRQIDADEVLIIPGVSSFSLAASRLGWSIESVECLTLHGRPIDRMRPHIVPGNRLLILSANSSTPSEIAQCLINAGFGESSVAVLSHLAGPQEAIEHGTAGTVIDSKFPALNLVAVDCKPSPTANCHSSTPGLPDDAFQHDGQITKREVRAVTLAALGPLPGELMWDVGAGCGSVAIEWMRSSRRMRAVAIEKDEDRVSLIRENARLLGTPDIECIHGKAPDALPELARPNAIFIGGGVSEMGILEKCIEHLVPDGRLVANAVSLEGESVLISAQKMWGGELVRIAIDRMDMLGEFRGWDPLRPVVQLRIKKS